MTRTTYVAAALLAVAATGPAAADNPLLPPGDNVIIVGPDALAPPEIRVFDARTGALRRSFMAFDPSFTGGVRVAAGDVNGDGVDDIITAAGPGGGPHVKVFDGINGSAIASFFAFDPSFSGGVNVAVGDVNNDGFADIITGAGPGGAPALRVFDVHHSTVPIDTLPYTPTFAGGVNVAAGRFDADPADDFIVAPASGPAPVIVTSSGTLQPIHTFDPFGSSFTGGVFVATGDINNDGVSDIVTGAGPGAGPQVKVFNGRDLGPAASFFAYDPQFAGGVRVASGDFNGDGTADIVTGAGPGGGPHVKVFDAAQNQLQSFLAFPGASTDGVFVAAGRSDRSFITNATATQLIPNPGTGLNDFDPTHRADIGLPEIYVSFVPFQPNSELTVTRIDPGAVQIVPEPGLADVLGGAPGMQVETPLAPGDFVARIFMDLPPDWDRLLPARGTLTPDGLRIVQITPGAPGLPMSAADAFPNMPPVIGPPTNQPGDWGYNFFASVPPGAAPGYLWANPEHFSIYAVGYVPEPASGLLLLPALAVLLRRPRSARRPATPRC